jgi:anti-sigma regulatory factor (Ser/Thr protein kinase)
VGLPFNAILEKDFINREEELAYLRRLAHLREGAVSGNVLLEGARGIGKTELLKQIYRSIFWEENEVIPFYFCFQRATLKAAHFAKDYFSRFLRQYLAYVKKDPSFIVNMSTPLTRLMPTVSSLGMDWMADLIEDFLEQTSGGGLYERMLAAVSAPAVTASRSGKPVLVLLDDFHLATRLYEAHPGDSPGLISLFEDYMKASLSPHVIAGSPEGALEQIFTDDCYRGKAERIQVRPLPEDVAFSLLKSLCARLQTSVQDDCKGYMKFLGGNPLYIRNMAKAFWRMRRKEVTRRDFRECYSHEVSEGETAFYWSSVLGAFLGDVEGRRLAVEMLMHCMVSDFQVRDMGRLARRLGMPEPATRETLAALRASGVIQAAGGIRPLRDPVLRDFIRALYMREVEARPPEKIRELIEKRRYPDRAETSHFEMTIPMTSDAELVAARVVEQIGKNISLKPEVITQLQLALIEACINAMEHSGSYEKKVLLRFDMTPRRVEIVIESPGRAFSPAAKAEPRIEDKLRSENKRGWGLKLMREIMDEVKVETMEDRTRVILVKNIEQR